MSRISELGGTRYPECVLDLTCGVRGYGRRCAVFGKEASRERASFSNSALESKVRRQKKSTLFAFCLACHCHHEKLKLVLCPVDPFLVVVIVIFFLLLLLVIEIAVETKGRVMPRGGTGENMLTCSLLAKRHRSRCASDFPF